MIDHHRLCAGYYDKFLSIMVLTGSDLFPKFYLFWPILFEDQEWR